jgi:hypothetical protein
MKNPTQIYAGPISDYATPVLTAAAAAAAAAAFARSSSSRLAACKW